MQQYFDKFLSFKAFNYCPLDLDLKQNIPPGGWGINRISQPSLLLLKFQYNLHLIFVIPSLSPKSSYKFSNALMIEK